MSDESEPSPGFQQLSLIAEVQPIADHPLLQVEPREEGGVTSHFKSGYQLELAAYTCIEMLLPENGIVSVAVELHEDYVVEYDDGRLDFRQVKHKDEGHRVNLHSLAIPLHNLYEQFKKYSDPRYTFTVQCNRGAYPSERLDLLELKLLLIKKRKRLLDPVDENRLTLLKNIVCQLPVFQNDEPACVLEAAHIPVLAAPGWALTPVTRPGGQV